MPALEDPGEYYLCYEEIYEEDDAERPRYRHRNPEVLYQDVVHDGLYQRA